MRFPHLRRTLAVVAAVVVVPLAPAAHAADRTVYLRAGHVTAAQARAVDRAVADPDGYQRLQRAINGDGVHYVVTDLATFADGTVSSTVHATPTTTAGRLDFQWVTTTVVTPLDADRMRVETRSVNGFTKTEVVNRAADCRLDCAEGWAAAAGTSAGFCAGVAGFGPFGWAACAIYAADSAYLAQRNCEACANTGGSVTITPAYQESRGGYGPCSPSTCAYYTVCYSTGVPNGSIRFDYGSNAPIQGPYYATANGFCSATNQFYQGWNPTSYAYTYTQMAEVCAPGNTACQKGYASTKWRP